MYIAGDPQCVPLGNATTTSSWAACHTCSVIRYAWGGGGVREGGGGGEKTTATKTTAKQQQDKKDNNKKDNNKKADSIQTFHGTYHLLFFNFRL